MTVTSSRRPAEIPALRERCALVVADTNWFTTDNLFREVRRDGVSTLLLTCMDFVNAWRQGKRPWSWNAPVRPDGPGLWRGDLVLPSGWMKRYPRLGMRPIGRTIKAWRGRHAPGSPMLLVMTYPHYLYLRDAVRPSQTVYYNLDDYTLFWPKHAERIRALERRAVIESDLTVCVSRVRADELRAAIPEAADRIRHLPHGAPTSVVAEQAWHRPAPPPDDIAGLPRPLLGCVGSLNDRVDWKVLTRLSEALPEASIVLVGTPRPDRGEGGWEDDRRACLERPNVHAIGWRPQAAIAGYNRSFDVCLIPYRVDHPFNRACSPTKIMDCMGSGRPIVSTAIPECALYRHLFDVADDPAAFVSAVQSIIASGSDDGRAAERLAHARNNTCAAVADRILDLLLKPGSR